MVYVWTCASNKFLCLLTVGLHFFPVSGSPSLRVTACWLSVPSTFICSALPLHSFSFPIVLFYQPSLQSLSIWIFIWGSLSIWSPLWCFINIYSILFQDYFPWFSHCTLLKTFESLNYWMNWPQKQNLFWLQKLTLGNAFNYQEYFNAHIKFKNKWGIWIWYYL